MIPALIRRFHEAKVSGAKEVVVWGTGNVRREFLHVDDMADACLFVMNLPGEEFRRELLSYPMPCFVNVGTGEDVSIRELADLVATSVGYQGHILFDAEKPDGTPKKLLDVLRLADLGWKARLILEEGVDGTYRWFLRM